MNPWNPRRQGAGWIESRTARVRHFVDWRDNVLCGHERPALQSRLTVSRARAAWFRDGEYADLVARRSRAGLPPTDLASEDSEDALTWSVFSALATAPTSMWWSAFELAQPPEIELWPRHETSDSELARTYRECGAHIERFHRREQRSEIDVLLSTPALDVLVEVKWKAPIAGGKATISPDAMLDSKIRDHLAPLAASVLVPGVSLDDALAAGAYQTLRHVLYAHALTAATGRPARLAYLVREKAIGIRSAAPAACDGIAHELFGGLFREPLPLIVSWRRFTERLPDDVLDEPLPAGELHAGATLREYLVGRRVSGRPAALALPRPHASPDRPLVLVDVCADQVIDGLWTRRRRDWPVQTPRAKLIAKYSTGTSALFGHYVYRFPHRDPDRITPIDIEAADRLMGANISAQHNRREAVLELGASAALSNALARIPSEATVHDAAHDAATCDAIAALTSRPGIGLAIATKLLCIKRPALVPMMDSVVQGCFGTDNPAQILRAFRHLVSLPVIAAHLDELAGVVASLVGFAPTAVRILDELIWFDWNLERGTHGVLHVVGFRDWGYHTAHDDRGVHWLGSYADTAAT